MLNGKVWQFSRIDFLYDAFDPLTPLGRRRKQARAFIADRHRLDHQYDLTDAALALIDRYGERSEQDEHDERRRSGEQGEQGERGGSGGRCEQGDRGEWGERLDRITYHLKRIPDLPDLPEQPQHGDRGERGEQRDQPDLPDRAGGPALSPALSPAEVFQVKKFLLNYRAVFNLLDAPARRAFGISFELDELLSRLDIDADGQETFYISDRYSDELRTVRREIMACDGEIKELRDRACQALLDRYGLDFRFRDFLVVTNERAAGLDRNAVFIEPHDSRNVIVKPVMSEEYFRLRAGREQLAVREKLIESRVLAELSGEIRRRGDVLGQYAARLAQFDVSLARAGLCRRFGLVRPRLAGPRCAITLTVARLLPLEDRCRRQGLKYWPLDIRLAGTGGVIHGSNMCGKTVAVQTLAFCQLAAQLGFHVPAEGFETSVFDDIFFVGPTGADLDAGLSSFAAEIVGLSDALSAAGESKLLLIDEFARTTNSTEAVALLSGLLAWLSGRAGLRTLLATHYGPLPRFDALDFYRMKGLRWDAFERDRGGADGAAAADLAADLAARLRNIHRYVDYEVVLDADDKQTYDALRVAEALGLDEEIINLARRYIEPEES